MRVIVERFHEFVVQVEGGSGRTVEVALVLFFLVVSRRSVSQIVRLTVHFYLLRQNWSNKIVGGGVLVTFGFFPLLRKKGHLFIVIWGYCSNLSLSFSQ